MQTPDSTRRQLLAAASAWAGAWPAFAALGASTGAHAGEAPAATPRPDARPDAPRVQRLAASWRGPRERDPFFVGALDLDWQGRALSVAWSQPLPGRAHGLLPLDDGGLLVAAVRPGTWLMRLDTQGQVTQRLALDDEADGHRLDGHALTSADRAWIYTPQTDPQGRGWLALRDPRSLRTVDRWPTHGIDPHQLLLDADGHVMLAHGGIPRTATGRKHQLDRMASSLVRLDRRNGSLRGRWTLDDPRLSLRHMAWARPTEAGTPLLGVALQAEHDDPGDRAAAPLLAVWDGVHLQAAPQAAGASGYAGDITAAGPGGFAVSAQHAGSGLVWWPGLKDGAQAFARIEQPCALATPTQGPDRGAVLLAGALGVARWHPQQPPAMLRWPAPMVLDNHWVELATG